MPSIEGFTECYGKSIHHCPYCDGWENRGNRIFAYSSNAHAAIGLAIALRGRSTHITVLTDGSKIACRDDAKLRANNMDFNDQKLTRILHQGNQFQGVEFADGSKIYGDSLFFNTTQRPHSDLPKRFECKLDSVGRAKTYYRQNIQQPGVFVVGDADGDVQFVIVAAAEGAIAAVAVNRELQDDDRL